MEGQIADRSLTVSQRDKASKRCGHLELEVSRRRDVIDSLKGGRSDAQNSANRQAEDQFAKFQESFEAQKAQVDREVAQLRAMVAEKDKVIHYLEDRIRDFEIRDSKQVMGVPIQPRKSPAAIHEARERREQNAIIDRANRQEIPPIRADPVEQGRCYGRPRLTCSDGIFPTPEFGCAERPRIEHRTYSELQFIAGQGAAEDPRITRGPIRGHAFPFPRKLRRHSSHRAQMLAHSPGQLAEAKAS